MRPVLFSVLGVPVQSYGVSKALAALVAAWLLGRAFANRGLDRDHAYSLTFAAAIWGFLGGKLYYLGEHARTLTWHDLGGMGFTWYGGFLAGTTAFVVLARRRGLPVVVVTGLAVAPLSVAYGIGRLGCLLAGDGTYGRLSGLPWAVAMPNGVVPTTVAVQPTPVYEALAAFALATLLWRLQRDWNPTLVVAVYLIGTGTARLLVEMLRTNKVAIWGLTQPQVWSLLLMISGAALLAVARRTGWRSNVLPVETARRTATSVEPAV